MRARRPNQDSGFCRWESKDYIDIAPSIERFNVFARGAYNFTDTIQGYTELSYFEVKTTARNPPPLNAGNLVRTRPTTSFNSTLNIYLPVGHPDNPFSGRQPGCTALLRGCGPGRPRHGSTRPRRSDTCSASRARTTDGTGTSRGCTFAATTNINLPHFYQYDRLLAGVAGTGPYGYYRVGANAALNNPAIYDWIAPDVGWTTLLREHDLRRQGLARHLQARRRSDWRWLSAMSSAGRRSAIPARPGTDTGNVVGFGYSAAFGSRNVNAVYAELYAPVLKNLEADGRDPLRRLLGRRQHVEPEGRRQVDGHPVSSSLRGTWATAFRAPGLYETSTANVRRRFTVVVDPVRCPVTGSPADCAAQVLGINTGNPVSSSRKRPTPRRSARSGSRSRA